MSSLWLQLRYEWKMLLRSPISWLGLVLVCWFSVLYFLGYTLNADTNFGEAASTSAFLLFFFCFAAMLVAVDSGRREKIENTGSLRYTMPNAGFRWLIVKWLALLIPFTLLAWFPLCIYVLGWFPHLLDPGATIGLFFLASFAIPMWFVVIVGFTIGERIQSRWSYVLAILLYMAFVYGIQIVMLGRLNSPLQLINILGHMSITDLEHFSLFWGFELDRLAWLHRLVYVGLTAALMMGAGYVYGQRRRERSAAVICARIGAAAMAVVIGAASLYLTEAAKQRHSAEQTGSAAGDGVSQLERSSRSDVLLPADYRIQLAVGASGKLTLMVQLHMSAPERPLAAGEPIELFLDPAFSDMMVDVDGKRAEWSRTGNADQVAITLPERMERDFVMEFRYEGILTKWMIGKSSYGLPKVKRHTFANSTEVRLPEDTYWYPVPAVWPDESLPPVAYELDVTGPTRMNMIAGYMAERSETVRGDRKTTLLRGSSRTPIILIGGPFHVVEAQSERTKVTLVESAFFGKEAGEKEAKQIVRMLDRTADFVESTASLHGLSFNFPERIVLVPDQYLKPGLFVNNIIKELFRVNTKEHFESGWLQMNDRFPLESFHYSHLLLWLFMEQPGNNQTLEAPMSLFYRMLREYVLADPATDKPFTDLVQFQRVYDAIGKERFPTFVWAFYRFLQGLDAQPERQMNSSSDERRAIVSEYSRAISGYINAWRIGELP